MAHIRTIDDKTRWQGLEEWLVHSDAWRAAIARRGATEPAFDADDVLDSWRANRVALEWALRTTPPTSPRARQVKSRVVEVCGPEVDDIIATTMKRAA